MGDLEQKTVKIDNREIAVDNSGEGKPLGYLFWYSISHEEIKVDEMRRLCVDNNLSFERFFFEIKRENVYMNVTKTFEDKNVLQSGTFTVLVRTVTPEGKRASGKKRFVVEEYRANDNSKPKYTVLGYWNFDVENESVESVSYFKDGDPEHTKFQEMTGKLKQDMDYYMDIYTDKHIRDALRRIMKEIKAIPLRPSGGVYFSPWKSHITLESVDELVNSFGDSTEIYLVKVVDNEREKDMLFYKFEEYAIAQAEALIEEVKGISESGKKVRTSTFKRVVESAQSILETRKEYEEALNTEFSKADFIIEVLERNIQELSAKVGGGEQ